MKKNTTTVNNTNLHDENRIRFQLPSIVTAIKKTVTTILNKFFTVDLPIAYANIRVWILD